MELIIILIIAAGLGIITGKNAEKKGHNFWLWWFYGWMLFIVAIIHVQYIPDRNETHSSLKDIDESIVTQLERYKRLLDLGAITKEEFEEKKQELLKRR